jgi:transcriptional regulator with XRE-family HTH domain
MEFKDWLRRMREKRHISQQELADRLSELGYETSYARVSHWETGRNKPPLEDSGFRHALATALEIDSNTMMIELGFVTLRDDMAPEARVGAEIIENLPAEGRELALDLLRTIQKRYMSEPN